MSGKFRGHRPVWSHLVIDHVMSEGMKLSIVQINHCVSYVFYNSPHILVFSIVVCYRTLHHFSNSRVQVIIILLLCNNCTKVTIRVFQMKTSACRVGTIKNQPNKMGMTPQHHPYILCHFANYALCLLVVCIGS